MRIVLMPGCLALLPECASLRDPVADLRAAVRRYSLPQPGAEVVVERSTLGPEIAALGAATLPLDHFIEHGWSL